MMEDKFGSLMKAEAEEHLISTVCKALLKAGEASDLDEVYKTAFNSVTLAWGGHLDGSVLKIR